MVIFNSYFSLPEGRLKSTQIWHRSIAVASMSALPLASASLPRSLYPRYGARKVTRETAENPQKVKWYYLLLPLFRILYPTTWYIILWKIPNGGMSKISSHLIPSDTYSTPSMWRMCSALTNRRWRFLRRHVNTSQQRWSSAGSSEGFQSCAKKGVKQWLWC